MKATGRDSFKTAGNPTALLTLIQNVHVLNAAALWRPKTALKINKCMINPNKRGMVAATQKQGMLEIILQLNRRCWKIFSNAQLNCIVSIQKQGSFLSLDLFSTKTRKSHEQVKLPKF